MAWIKCALLKRSFALSLALALITGFSISVITPQALRAQGIPDRWQASAYQPPTGLGKPGRREGAGTRGPANCPVANKPLTAFVPSNNFGVTVAAYPSFSFYMPQMQAREVEFVLKDENNEEVYSTSFITTGESGVISLSLPADSGLPPLELGKNYHWSFSIVCTPQDRGLDLGVEGTIRRVELNAGLDSKLKQANLKNRPDIYAESEIWYEALTALIQLRRTYPDDPSVTAEWTKLLKSVGLESLVGEPLATTTSSL